MKISTMLYVTGMALFAATFSMAQNPGTVTGTLTVGGKAIKLSNAQALEADDWDYDAQNHKFVPVKIVRVFLSDAPVADIEDNFDMFLKAREGKLHAVSVNINRKGEVGNGMVIHQAFSSGAITFSGSNQTRFQRKVLDAKSIAGKVSTVTKQEFQEVTFEFKLTFSTAIQREPKPTVEGAAAETTGAARTAREFLKAAQARDTAALRGIFRAEIAMMLDDSQRKGEVMGLMEASYPAEQQFKIVRVFDFGDRAWVEALSERPSESGGAPVEVTTRIRLVRVNGEWKVQPM